MKSLGFLILACLASCPCLPQAVNSSTVSARLSKNILLKDPAGILRTVSATRLLFSADRTYRFTVRYLHKSPDDPTLRLFIYEATQQAADADCAHVECWTKLVSSSSAVDKGGNPIERVLKKGTELLVILWQGGDVTSAVGCGNTFCDFPLSSTSEGSKLELKSNGPQGSVVVDVEALAGSQPPKSARSPKTKNKLATNAAASTLATGLVQPAGPTPPSIIQVSVEFTGTQRIVVPVGQLAYVAALITGPDWPKEISFYQIDNRNGNTVIWWPTKDFMDAAKRQDPNVVFYAFKCDVTNRGDTNLIKVIVPLVAHFVIDGGQQQRVERQITLGPIDRGATKTVYIVNNCTLPGSVMLPHKGYAQVPGEPEARDFDFEWVDTGATGVNYGINPSAKGFPWTFASCQ
jgi:hypothetical protein